MTEQAQPNHIQPMPSPFSFGCQFVNVKMDPKKKPEPMLAMEFHGVQGVAVYFVNKEMLSNLVDGLAQQLANFPSASGLTVARHGLEGFNGNGAVPLN